MKRKTYGVSGLMDWAMQIKVGKGVVTVHFTGGALTAYGVTPAKFSTSNTFFQKVIECSDHFKNGRIALLSSVEIPDTPFEKARKEKLAARATTAVNTSDTTTEEIVSEQPADNLTVQYVSDKTEAIEYLKENFKEKNYTSTSLRTKSAFDAACAECGIKFVFQS